MIGTVITLFFLFITFTGVFDFTDAIEMKTFDLRARIAAPEERNPDIELVVISEEDLAERGRWPWSRNIIAQGIHNLSQAGARVIALNILFAEPEESAGLRTIKDLKESFDSSFANHSPGHVLKKHAISTLIDESIECYDFMGQCEPYKMRWTDQTYERLSCALFNRNVPGYMSLIQSCILRRSSRIPHLE